jgi:hypothetical protein
MTHIKRLGAVIVAASAVLMATAVPAWAPRNLFTSGVVGECRTGDAKSSLAGGLEVESFTNRDGLVAISDVNVGCPMPGDTEGRQFRVDVEDMALPVTITRATCTEFYFSIDPFTVDDVEVVVTTEMQFFVFDPLIDANRVGKRLCTVERNLDTWSDEHLARVLNAILFDA